MSTAEPENRFPGTWALILAAIFTGTVHSWLMYSLSIYSLHEGAAHNLIFPGTGPISRAASFLSTNMCRLAAMLWAILRESNRFSRASTTQDIVGD